MTGRETTAAFDERVALARRLMQEQRFAEAEVVLRELNRVEPANEAILDSLAWVLERHGKLGEAFDRYREAVARGAYPAGPDFDRLYERAMLATGSTPTPLRRRGRFHALLERLSATAGLAGCVVECGCYRGLSSYLLCAGLRQLDPRFTGRGYHIFDSFQGLGEPTPEDDPAADDPAAGRVGMLCKAGAFAASLEEVRRNLADFPEIEYHPGWIPLTFRGLPELKYRFVHLDVDLYDPTLSALDYFHPRLERGGAIVCDDYGWPGARQAIGEYCAEQRIDFTLTAFGQAVIVR